MILFTFKKENVDMHGIRKLVKYDSLHKNSDNKK